MRYFMHVRINIDLKRTYDQTYKKRDTIRISCENVPLDASLHFVERQLMKTGARLEQ